MPRSRYRIFETEYPYFMTCSIVGWLPVFTRTDAANIVFDSWRFLQRERGSKLFGYVMWQKLEYTHDNPIRRGYVDDPLHWRYSSARNYAKQPTLIDVVTDWM